jgi:hypothetical protein
MQLLKNRHLILAMFVAPTLAIIAYFGVDYVVSEKPQVAQQGKAYKLAAKSNCRYQSGACTLKNADIEVHLQANRIDDEQVGLTLSSATPIQNALISLLTDEIETEPVLVNEKADQADARYVILDLKNPEQSTLRLALNISGSMYYAETSAIFVDYITSFSRENFQD